jgi:regulator of RNase E activity RraA
MNRPVSYPAVGKRSYIPNTFFLFVLFGALAVVPARKRHQKIKLTPQGQRINFYTPSDMNERKTLLKLYRNVRVADIADALDQLGYEGGTMSPGIHALTRTHIAGIARTVRYIPFDPKLPEERKKSYYINWFKDMVREGDIFIVDQSGVTDAGALGSENTLMGRLNGAAGYVTNGGVRDTDEMVRQETPVWYHSVAQRYSIGRVAFDALDIPVTVGGVTVSPGDIVVADGDGVIVVPRDMAHEVYEIAANVRRSDMAKRREYYRRMGWAIDETVERFADTAASSIDTESMTNEVPPFRAAPATAGLKIDGEYSAEEWGGATLYPCGYNQLDSVDLTTPPPGDMSVWWAAAFRHDTLFGVVGRIDDSTVAGKKRDGENDAVVVVIKTNDGEKRCTAYPGMDFVSDANKNDCHAVWNDERTVMEFYACIPLEHLEGKTIGWNIGARDYDSESAPGYFLFPVNGSAPSAADHSSLSALTFGTPSDIDSACARNSLDPFVVSPAQSVPQIDGAVQEREWEGAVVYPLPFNHLNPADMRPPAPEDLSVSWALLYRGNTLYGLVRRADDTTVATHPKAWLNDAVDIFLRASGTFSQMRTVVGKNFRKGIGGRFDAVWSSDGSILEFMIEVPGEQLDGLTRGFSIAVSDNDRGADATRDHILYPINGYNNNYKNVHLGKIHFAAQ